MDAAVHTVLGGVDTHGCREQTMILMALIVYAMKYLHGTYGVSPQAEQ